MREVVFVDLLFSPGFFLKKEKLNFFPLFYLNYESEIFCFTFKVIMFIWQLEDRLGQQFFQYLHANDQYDEQQ